ncbi:hypothetical protein LCGC14_2150330 [marine sediment metagenome]|uniref:Uncharacterized protein n=1 Tax=marine sediment metagenome TaxID=412755 RepID=A0A0F9DVX1_9ZZZZ
MKWKIHPIILISLIAAFVMGFVLGMVMQQSFFIKGAVAVAEGFEGTEFNLEIDINETIMATTFFKLINNTLQDDLKEPIKQSVVEDRN